jgi:hypothetical protein
MEDPPGVDSRIFPWNRPYVAIKGGGEALTHTLSSILSPSTHAIFIFFHKLHLVEEEWSHYLASS